MIETVLSIAGSDPTGGAGIQADLKTMTAIGVYGAAVVTCITVQNSRAVSRVEPLHPALVDEQISAVLEDHRVCCIKIGMVGTAAIARVIGARLKHFDGEVIYDPVLVSTTGQALTEPLAVEDIRASLICRATVLTPNLPELETLTGKSIETERDIGLAAEKLMRDNPRLRSVLVTGGHADRGSTLTDYLFHRSNGTIAEESLSHLKIITSNNHGTGCTLSSAFAAYLALGFDDLRAFSRSVAFLQSLLERSASAEIIANPGGKGSLLHFLGHR